MLNRDAIVSQLNNRRYRDGLLVLDSIQSTNTRLRKMALAGAAEGSTLIAATQTGGRGRRGRTFSSSEGGVYLSTLLRPTAPTDPGLITCRAAVAAARAIESLCDLTVEIKWVNDLYIAGRKVAGILAEGVLAPDGGLSAVVLGIGINVCNTLPDDLADIATTLQAQGVTVTREAVAAAFLNEWERALTDPHWMAEYRRRNLVIGRPVTVMQGDTSYAATALDVTDSGHLVVSTPEGERTLSSGEVSVRL